MGFNIPMSTKGAMSADSLMSLNGGGAGLSSAGANTNTNTQQPMPQQNTYQQPVQQSIYQQPAQQNTYQQSTPQPQKQGVFLKKGQKSKLVGTTGNPLTRIKVGLGWTVNNMACDLDASAFMLGGNNKVIGDDWFVFYGQTVSPDNSVIHSGDEQTGARQGDDETITINLAMVNQQVQKIVFIVTINEALEKGLNFSMISDAYVRIVDEQTNNEIARFNLTDYYANVTSMVVGEVYRYQNEWKFNAIGDGVAKDLAGLCEMYGVNVAD